MDRALRTLHAGVTAGWLGAALLAAFVVAPHAFAAFPARQTAGEFVGGVLWFVNRAALGSGLIALGCVWARPARRTRVRFALAAAFTASGAASLATQAKLASMRAAMGAIDLLDPADPRRRAFGALHGVSMIVLLCGMLAALGSLIAEGGQSGKSSDSG